MRSALGLTGDEFEPVAAAEVDVPAADPSLPPQRIGVSVQVITEGGTRMGALVTLRDLESLETISRQLQVSERLAALGRVTAGVAHEVKNPLNSMRLWLENLKENLPAGDGVPRQAVAVLDSEIDRLDSVVKRFLDFMRPQELRLEETRLDELLDEVAAIGAPPDGALRRRAGESSMPSCRPVRVDRAAAHAGPAESGLQRHSGHALGRQTHARCWSAAANRAEIRIADTGQGHRPGTPRPHLSTVLYHPSGRQRHRPGQRL